MLRFAALAVVAMSFASEPGPRIFVYAQRDTPARRWTPVTCDGSAAAEIRQGVYFAVNVSAGRHTLAIAGGVPLTVEARAGADSFVRLDWHHEVGRAPVATLSGVDARRARKEMMFLSYAEAKRIHSAAVPKTDPRPPEDLRFGTREDRQ
ncbi:MAG: hypothetical protein U0Q16_29225 [Bryobacteraceae bacterium]